MYFFKNTVGNWIIGYTPDNMISKEPSRLLIHTSTNISVVTVAEGTVLIPPMEITDIKKNAEGDFYENYDKFVEGVSGFFVNAPLGGGVEIVNDLTTGGTTKALSAEQGKILKNSKMNRMQNGTGDVDKTILQTLVGLGFDLSNATLSNANLSNAILSNANLYNAILSNAILSNAILYNAILKGADLSNAYLYNTNLEGADLSNAYLYNTNLEGANLSNAYLGEANLANANLSNATGLNSDINIALAEINKDSQYDGLPWTLTWTDGVTYQCNPATGLFTIQN